MSFMRAPRSEWIYRFSLLLGCAVTRLAYGRTGMRFRADTIDYFAQFLDPPLLRDRLLESLWFLHAQPPLLNLSAGLALKIAPDDPGRILQPLFLAASFASCGWLAGVLRRLGLGRPLAATIAILFTATPPFVLYEHWFFYPHLSQALLLLAGYCFLRSSGTANRWMAGGFWTLTTLVALRSLYHPIFLVLAAAATFGIVSPAGRRRIPAVAAAPVTVALLFALKNLVLFGFFGTSSWGGNSFHRMFTETIEAPVVEAMIERGELGPISREWEFSRPEVYLDILAPEKGPTGIPALDTTGKTAARQNPVNYNHWIYPIASKAYAVDALRLLRAHPAAYAGSIRWTAARFLDPVTDDAFLKPNRFWIKRSAAWWERLEEGAGYRLVAFAALVWAIVAVSRRRTAPGERVFLAFAAGTILWTAAVGILLEYGENNRFRYQVTALGWILVAYGVRDLLRAMKTLRRFPG